MATFLQKMFTSSAPSQVAPGLYRINSAYVNAYLLGEPGEPFVLVDTGMPFSAEQIKKAVDDRFGVQARPEAIVLTHGHFDHAGSVEELSRYWDVPVYVHPMEIPYVTGQSEYPPADPTVGGFGGQLSRFYTNKPYNVSERVHQLPADGSVPGFTEWKWLYTPGHTPGHISLFREKDAVLVAGDALTTMNMRNMGDMMSGKPELNGPPEYFTPDWILALKSIDELASLRPSIIAAGHGEPLYYRGLELDLIDFADRFLPPKEGRYVDAPAHFDETGLVSLPPPAKDPLPKIMAGTAAGLLATITTIGIVRNRKKVTNNYKLRSPIKRKERERVVLQEEKPRSWRESRRKEDRGRVEGKRKERAIFRSAEDRRPKKEERPGIWRIFSYRKEKIK